jgi:hypothetical protein
MVPEYELEKLEKRIAANSARMAAIRVQRALLRPGGLEEHDRRIDQLERWKAIQERLLLILREESSRPS